MSNYEIIVNTFKYLLEDRDIDCKYIEKLFRDVRICLLQEGIVCRLRVDSLTGAMMMFVSDVENEETELIFRDDEK